MRNKFILILIFVIFTCFALVGCKSGGASMDYPYEIITPSDKAIVHDPSVFYDEASGKYYAFGSHFAVASSTDLVNWKQEVREYVEADKLYGTKDFRSILVKSDEFNGRDGNINSTWAPDVIKYNGKYYMYFALTSKFGSGKSSIGRVSSVNVLGPYSNEEVLIYSHDLWWEEPNAIDPELFFDKEGRLWMVYGSYFAGIYVKELHNSGEKFGLPKEDGFGKKVWWDGYSSGVEGPFIFYAEETDYYYLMVSEGNLASNYNMRIARSKTLDGPYLDITGNDVVGPNGKGNKLSSNYRFSSEDYGHAALGHNSVIKKDGEYFCIYHERSSSGNKIIQHYNVKTRKLVFNEDGWPMLAVNEYRGELAKEIKKDQISGEYDLIIHYEETIDDVAQSIRLTFSKSGAILQDNVKIGSYSFKDNEYIKLKINGAVYNGKVSYEWVDYLNKISLSISAISNEGVPIFANKI